MGVKGVITPVRRSLRKKSQAGNQTVAEESPFYSSKRQPKKSVDPKQTEEERRLGELLAQNGYAYVPNKALPADAMALGSKGKAKRP